MASKPVTIASLDGPVLSQRAYRIMSKVWDPKRRRLLEATVAAGVVGPAISCSAPKSPWRYFTVEEASLAAAICDQLIPADQFPGAVWAGAIRYIDRQLCGHLRKHRATYRLGLAAVDRSSREQYGTGFATLSADRQVSLLKAIEKGNAPVGPWKQMGQKEFFALILAHTMQSYYGDPRHGGNRDGAGYRSVGIPLTPVRGRSKHDLTGGTK